MTADHIHAADCPLPDLGDPMWPVTLLRLSLPGHWTVQASVSEERHQDDNTLLLRYSLTAHGRLTPITVTQWYPSPHATHEFDIWHGLVEAIFEIGMRGAQDAP